MATKCLWVFFANFHDFWIWSISVTNIYPHLLGMSCPPLHLQSERLSPSIFHIKHNFSKSS